MFNLSRKNDKNFLGNNFFDEFFNTPFFSTSLIKNSLMKTNFKEEKDRYLIDVEIPGFKKEDIKISLNEGYLTVEATKNDSVEEKDKEGKYIRRERYYGNMKRSFYVGKANENDIIANFNNGVLNLIVNKKPEIANKKYISIE